MRSEATVLISTRAPANAATTHPRDILNFLVEVRRPRLRVEFPRSREARRKGFVAETGVADRLRTVGDEGQISVTVIRGPTPVGALSGVNISFILTLPGARIPD